MVRFAECALGRNFAVRHPGRKNLRWNWDFGGADLLNLRAEKLWGFTQSSSRQDRQILQKASVAFGVGLCWHKDAQSRKRSEHVTPRLLIAALLNYDPRCEKRPPSSVPLLHWLCASYMAALLILISWFVNVRFATSTTLWAYGCFIYF